MILKKLSLLLFVFCVFNRNIEAQTTSNINCLKFTSVAQYEQAVANFYTNGFSAIDGYSTYTSMQSTFLPERPPAGYNDPQPADDYDVNDDVRLEDSTDYSKNECLSYLLSSEKVVIIGNWIIKIDLSNSRALMLNTANASEYNDLLNDNLANVNIRSYGLDEEGIEIINQLDGNGVAGRCSGRYARPKKDEAFGYYGNRHRLDMKVVYQGFFVFFSLEGKAKTQVRFLRIWWHDNKDAAYMKNINLFYSPRCSNSYGFNGDPSGNVGYQSGSTCTYRPYLSSRGLKEYDYAIDFGSGYHGSGHVEIHDH